MSGDYDPATPPEYGEIALRSFPKGQHVIDPMGGHGIAFVDGCTVSILNAFIAGPEEVVESNCLTGQERKINLLQPDNISAPFLVKMPENYDIFALSVLIPSIIFIVMTFRGAFQYLRNLWKRNRGTASHNTARENLLQLRFELSSWIFILGCLLYLIALYLIIYRLNDNPAHFYALAVPTGARGVLFIAALLTLVLIIVFISAIQLWRYRRKVFGRTYLVLQVIFGGFFLAYLVWTDLLWAWAK
jgi:uncharacterized integral membrane protein